MPMPELTKNWDHHVVHAEAVARTQGFCRLRELILEWAEPAADDVVVDVGAGTGLLALALAPQVDRVWAVDISSAMAEYLKTKAASGDLDNIQTVVASAASLPLFDATADLVVSNYCFHHLDDDGKDHALAEAHRVLRPGGRLVFGDMMFRVGVSDARDREVVRAKVRSMVAKGPSGIIRLAKNGLRYASGRWEQPVPAGWWQAALERAGFIDVRVQVLEHEGGIASARKPPA
jgi:ubiquinone/menaquinone biosynthesis C-methylase UbiE